jgi:flagellar FliL protein
MAEEQDELLDDVEAEGEVPPKKSSLLKIIIILIVVAALAGGGYFGYTKFMKVETAPTEEIKEEGASAEEKGETALGIMFPLDPFLVNLAGSQGKRVLKVTVSLELSAPEVRAELNENLQKVVDSILVLLSSKTFEDVYSVQGKFKLKDEITTRVNRFLAMGHIRDAYFTEFIIQ